MKYALTVAFFALVFLVPGHAQTPPACFPFINGYHSTGPRLYVGEVGEHLYWFCASRQGGPVRTYGFSWPVGKRSEAAYASAIGAISSASAKVSEAQKQYAAAITFDCDDPEVLKAQTAGGQLCRERVRILQANMLSILGR